MIRARGRTVRENLGGVGFRSSRHGLAAENGLIGQMRNDGVGPGERRSRIVEEARVKRKVGVCAAAMSLILVAQFGATRVDAAGGGAPEEQPAGPRLGARNSGTPIEEEVEE